MFLIISIYIITLIICFFIEVNNRLKIFMHVADNKYVININKLRRINSKLLAIPKIKEILPFLIPLYNFYLIVANLIKYNESEPMMIDKLANLNCIMPIDRKLFKYYKQNRNYRTVFKITKHILNKNDDDDRDLKNNSMMNNHNYI